MNYVKLVFISAIICSTQLAHAQVFRADIQYVTIEDTLLIQSVRSIIAIENKNDTLFAQGYGYLNVGIDWIVGEGLGKTTARVDTVRTYDILVSFAHPSKAQNGLMPFYPRYYSLVDDRFIVFELPDQQHIEFSKNSIKVYEQIIEKHLEPQKSPSAKVLWKLDYHYQVKILQNRFSGEYEQPIVSKIRLL